MFRIRRLHDDVLTASIHGHPRVAFPCFWGRADEEGEGDPTGTWSLVTRDFNEYGRRIGALGLHTPVVQEGGYRNRTLGTNIGGFLTGLLKGAHER